MKIASEGRGGLTYYTGGILGIGASGSRIEACCNTGEIWCAHAAGGLIGGVKGRNPVCYSSYNTADVSGLYYAGGLCGVILSSIE